MNKGGKSGWAPRRTLCGSDEEPDDYKVFTEAQTRVLSSHGIVLVTFTPLEGVTRLVDHFVNPTASGIYLQGATWDEAPHLDGKEKERLLSAYPDYERDARTKGVPMLGSGRVFPFDEADIKIAPFKLPPHWAYICGIDFGIGHPAAGAWLAWDRDADVVYVYDCYRAKGEQAPYHAEAIKSRGKWIPVSWPHDGMQRDKGGDGFQNLSHNSAMALYRKYEELGCSMLPFNARYFDDQGG